MAVFFDPLSGNLISSPDSIQGGGTTDVLAAFANARIDLNNVTTPTAHTGMSSAAHVYSAGVSSYIDFTFDSAQPDTDYDVVVTWEIGPEFHEISAKTVNGFRAEFYDLSTGNYLSSGGVGINQPVITVYASDPITTVGGGGGGGIQPGDTIDFAPGTAAAPGLFPTGDTDTGIYSPGADTIGMSTGGTERASIDSSGNLSFDSGYGSSAVAYGCRAWVNFDGTFGTSPFTVANGGIRGSGNVSSITDNGPGNYTINYANNFPDVNYAITAYAINNDDAANAENWVVSSKLSDIYSVSQTQIRVYENTGSTTLDGIDSSRICVAVFR